MQDGWALLLDMEFVNFDIAALDGDLWRLKGGGQRKMVISEPVAPMYWEEDLDVTGRHAQAGPGAREPPQLSIPFLLPSA